MKIVVTRDGVEKSRENTGVEFDDTAAVKFLAEIMTITAEQEEMTLDYSKAV
jgi:hypothetical protein